MKRQLNREMKKLGFLPEKGREWRSPHLRNLARVYSNGTTRIGIFAGVANGQAVSKARLDKMPVTNRSCFSSESTCAGDARAYAEQLVRFAVRTTY